MLPFTSVIIIKSSLIFFKLKSFSYITRQKWIFYCMNCNIQHNLFWNLFTTNAWCYMIYQRDENIRLLFTYSLLALVQLKYQIHLFFFNRKSNNKKDFFMCCVFFVCIVHYISFIICFTLYFEEYVMSICQSTDREGALY